MLNVSFKSASIGAVCLLVTGLIPLLESTLRGEDRVYVLGGQPVTGTIEAITPAGEIRIAGQAQTISLADVRRVERNATPNREMDSTVQVYLLGGGVLQGSGVEIKDDVCTLDWQFGEPLAIPLQAVRAVKFASAGANLAASVHESFNKQLTELAGDMDQVLVIDGAQVQQLPGVLESLGRESVSFVWQDESRQIGVARVYAVVLAALSDPPDRTGQSQVSLADGSALWAKVDRLESGELQLTPAEGLQVSVPWNAVTGIAVRSERLVFLSDVEPVSSSQSSIVTFPRTFQRDASIEGRPLTLRGKVFEKGLGTQSRSETVYANEGFDLLAATVGIDDETSGRGDCEFVVLADGKEVYRQRATGQDPPVDLQVRVSGAAQISLVVEPGADLDLSDHADWCDLRLIKASAPAAPETADSE